MNVVIILYNPLVQTDGSASKCFPLTYSHQAGLNSMASVYLDSRIHRVSHTIWGTRRRS